MNPPIYLGEFGMYLRAFIDGGEIVLARQHFVKTYRGVESGTHVLASAVPAHRSHDLEHLDRVCSQLFGITAQQLLQETPVVSHPATSGEYFIECDVEDP
ncbi:MAG: hypothetical protein RLZZ347_85 [Candidatus Parcubacteria bacterium]|jgi:ribosomal protein L30E